MTNHKCPWSGCGMSVPDFMWGCKKHWFRLPKHLRDELWRTYRPGQNVATMSADYLAAFNRIEQWITVYEAEP